MSNHEQHDAPAESDKPTRLWDIFLAAEWRWGGPDGAGANSDPICDVQQIVDDVRAAFAPTGEVPDADAVAKSELTGTGSRSWSPVVRLSSDAAGAFLNHPRVVDWLRAAVRGMDRDEDGRGFTMAGLHFEVQGQETDVILLNSGVEVGRIRDVLQPAEPPPAPLSLDDVRRNVSPALVQRAGIATVEGAVAAARDQFNTLTPQGKYAACKWVDSYLSQALQEGSR